MSEAENITLPEGYTRVEYLESTGTQFIDTQIICDSESTFGCAFYQKNASNSPLFGCEPKNGKDFCAWLSSGTSVWMRIANESYYVTTETNMNRVIHWEFSKEGIFRNSNLIKSYNSVPNCVSSTYIFNRNPKYGSTAIGRLYKAYIKKGNEYVFNGIPCIEDSTNTPCLFDLVSQKPFYNQGSGKFLTNKSYEWNYPPINNNYNLPAGFKKCVYLQSDGTQYIDLDVYPNNETGLLIRAMAMGEANGCPMGSNNTAPYIYPPRKIISSSKQIAYTWNNWYNNSSVLLNWDKAGDLEYTSFVNYFNSRMVYFNSEDSDVVSAINSDVLPQLETNVRLFNWSVESSMLNSPWAGRIYRAQITQGDALIHDYVPCLDADKRPCMYDLIEEEALYNQSGGVEFTYCVEHQLPSDFSKLKYLESTGTQIIKTGIVPTDSTGIYVDAYHTKYNGNTNGSTIGLRNTNGNTYFYAPRVMRDTNGAGFGWGAFTTPGGNGNVRYEATLNFLNDRKAIITAPAFAQRNNALGTLSFTPSKDLYMFGMNNYDGAATSYSTYRIYRAKISEGTEIVRDFVPAWDDSKQKPCMYDLINNVAYYNDGEGEFVYNRDFEGTYRGFGVLGGIGNKLGSDYIFGDFVEVDFIEHDTQHKNLIDLLEREEPYDTASIGFYVECAYVDTTLKSAPISIWGFNGTMGTWFIKPLEKTRDYDDSVSGNYYVKNAYLGIIPVGTKLRGEMNFLMNKVHWVKGGNYHYKLSLENYEIESLTSGVYSYGILGPYCKLYKLKISQGKHITRDFIPVINNQGVPTLYDKIKNELFTPDVKNAIAGINSISKALRLKLPENGGSIKLSIPQEQTSPSHEAKIRANNPNWEITFYYH